MDVYDFFMLTTGAATLYVYLTIAYSQLRMRKKLEAEGVKIDFKMWMFPWLTWFVILVIMTVLGYMFLSPTYSYETTLSLGVTLLVVICGLFVTRKRIG